MHAASGHDARTVKESFGRGKRALTLLIALLGAAAFGYLVWRLGGAAVLASVASLGRAFPLLLLLEIGRLVCELVGTRGLLGAAGARLPFSRLLHGQLVGQALDVVMPAGRAAAEAAKAAIYARELGLPRTAAVGTALQLAALVANAVWALVGFLVSTGTTLPSGLRIGLIGYAGAMSGVVLAVLLFAASRPVRKLFRRVPTLHAILERFADLLVTSPRRLLLAVCAQLVGRGIQAVQLGIAAAVLGARPALPALVLTQAVYLVGAAAGDLVPAQLGATDAAFVYAAPALGMTQLAAFSVTLAAHAVQVALAGLSGLGAGWLWWRDARRPPPPSSTACDPAPEAGSQPTPPREPEARWPQTF
ncbi:MAG: lysylphosphatidylglycerol synthase transmembrane domain-containing protein [Polyangiales bacterium]